MLGAGQGSQLAFSGGAVGKGADQEPVAVVVLAPEFKGDLIWFHSVSPVWAGTQAGVGPINPYKNGAAIEKRQPPVKTTSKA